MHFPKYFNPHLTDDTTRTVSRKTLRLQDDVDADVEGGRDVGGVGLGGQEVEDLHAILDKVISERLKHKRAFVPSDVPHSSKRHKILAEEGESVEPQQHPEPVAFRLVSKSLPPRTIHLTPKPPKVISVKEPPCEDTEQELKERVYRSALSAVDLERIEHAFSTVYDRKPPRPVEISLQSQTTTSPLLLLEIPPAVPLSPPWISPRLNVLPKPSPHQLPGKGICCPIIFTDTLRHLRRHEKKGRRRRGKPKNRNKLVP